MGRIWDEMKLRTNWYTSRKEPKKCDYELEIPFLSQKWEETGKSLRRRWSLKKFIRNWEKTCKDFGKNCKSSESLSEGSWKFLTSLHSVRFRSFTSRLIPVSILIPTICFQFQNSLQFCIDVLSRLFIPTRNLSQLTLIKISWRFYSSNSQALLITVTDLPHRL